jgi:hypothetical protein
MEKLTANRGANDSKLIYTRLMALRFRPSSSYSRLKAIKSIFSWYRIKSSLISWRKNWRFRNVMVW